MRYISSVHVAGFRGVKDLSLSDLVDLNIFIGASNTGKSSLLEAISAPLAFQSGQGFSSIIRARSNLGNGMIASMFPNNDLSSAITISLGLPQSGVDDDDSIIEFTAKKAAALINDYQTYLSQANYTSFGQYIILEIAIKQTGKNRQAYQAAFNESDGSMAPLWNLGPASSDQPLVASLSLFLPRDLMSAEAFDKTYTHVFKSGHESEWIERLA